MTPSQLDVDLHDLTAVEAARAIRTGEVTPTALMEASLARIDALEPAVAAWVHLDREMAMQSAGEREREAKLGRSLGALHGVPVALKDIIDVAGLPTTNGAGAFAHRTPETDATSVARLWAAGALIMGKVSTTAFAYLDPSPTRNPWNLEHTPGGSSSGPAAAVAARMTPLALGSQTVGSVLRPAAYCGVVGFKPSHGRISTAGVTPLAWSLDHIGIFSRGVEDIALALGLMAGADAGDPRSSAAPVDDYRSGLADPPAPRLGLLRPLLERATPDMAAHLDMVIRAFQDQGASVIEVDLPPSFTEIHDAGRIVMQAEAAAAHHALFAAHAGDYPPKIREAVEDGQKVPALTFLLAQEARRRFREEATAVARRYDALLTPTVGAPAPKGLHSTGDPYFCAPWSSAGMPAIALPSGLADDGLPLSIQLVGAPFAEARLLAAAAWCEKVLDFDGQPTI
jgi:Asp-tRNA(Asn)/Glu-tRNA(Gln) amidotransferase A subunit family amidase